MKITLSNLLSLLIIISFQACKQGTTGSETSSVRSDITVAEAKNLLGNNDYVFLDVRTPSEISQGKIENAIEINYRADNFADKIAALDKSKKYVVYCRSGGRSAKTCDLLEGQNFSTVHNMLGGYSSWNN